METNDREKRLLIAKESELQESMQSLQKELGMSCWCNGTSLLNCSLMFKSGMNHLLLSILTADLRDDEATQQVESTQLAAAEIERLAGDKQRLAEHLQEEVRPGSTKQFVECR